MNDSGQHPLSALELRRLIAAGRFDQASALAKQQLLAADEPAAAEHVLGLCALQCSDYPTAVAHLRRAVEQASDNAWYWCNLGHALQQSGDHAAAKSACEQALSLRADYPQALFNLACAELAAGDTVRAKARFKQLTDIDPDSAEYRCALADACRVSGDWDSALRQYRKSLQLDPNMVRAEANLGALLVHFGAREQALQHCRRAVELAPEQALTHHLLGVCLYRLDRLDEAMDALADAYERNAESASLLADIGRGFSAAGDAGEAAQWYQQALTLDPDLAAGHCGLAKIQLDQGDTPAAMATLQQALALHPDEPELLKTWADALWDDGDADAALETLERAAAQQPHNAVFINRRAQILASSGRQAEAETAQRQALALNSDSIPALSGLAVSLRGKLDQSLADKMAILLDKPGLSLPPQIALHSGLAHYCDGTQDWAAAAHHMSAANALQWQYRSARDWHYSCKDHERYFEQLRNTFTVDHFQRTEEFGDNSLEPVFIVGMPRSGTTLTEQILGRHPAVLGIGERPFMSQSFHGVTNDLKQQERFAKILHIDALTVRSAASAYRERLAALKKRARHDESIRVVDKMPDNYSLIGWILTLFPRSRIIHIRRDLRDVALSCWLTQFGKIRWASRWPDLLHRIEQYRLMMAHWRQTVPGRFYEFEYESLVNAQEEQTHRLLDWLQLDWHPACLHPAASDQLVRTASINQVRQPVHTRSVERWRFYAEHIPELNNIPAV